MNDSLSLEDRRALLELARSAIGAKLSGTPFDDMATTRLVKMSVMLSEPRGCFVTIHKRHRLRGCIGNIRPVFALATAVVRNARSAAFEDPRFPPLTVQEFSTIDLEISVLSIPQEIKFNDADDLKKKIQAGIHGVVISKGSNTATYLPQVWEQLPDKEAFLSQLCIKAGLLPGQWQHPETTIEVYTAEFFGETQFSIVS